MKKYLLLLLFLFGNSNVYSSEFKTQEAKELAAELKYSINATLLKIMELESEGVNDFNAFQLSMNHQSNENTSLGVLLKSNGEVLAVTPNSPAEQLGIQSGDILTELSSGEIKYDLSKPVSINSRGVSAAAKVIRNNKSVDLTAKLQSKNIAWALDVKNEDVIKYTNENTELGCGQISIFFKPSETKKHYPVSYKSINGEGVVHSRKIIKLPVGKHKVVVHEAIQSRISSVKRPFMSKGKEIVVNIEPNKSYHLAAEFYPSKRFKVKNEEYWAPIVWNVTDKACEL